ncbi:MAG: hypothetical protein LBS09_05420 [Bacteroidales bacterium]|jgi:hypothetical protein|nr:hypothetical protein [Bacteroidales bacterium]
MKEDSLIFAANMTFAQTNPVSGGQPNSNSIGYYDWGYDNVGNSVNFFIKRGVIDTSGFIDLQKQI